MTTIIKCNPIESNGYYNPSTLGKFRAALQLAMADVKTGKETRVRISNSNSKMGAVASVSLVPFLSCPARCTSTCGAKCYAAKLANLRPNVLRSYAINQALATYAPALFWQQVNAAAAAVRYFRFHVAGDIMNGAYFAQMVNVARNNPHTEILTFTKRYEIVNTWIRENGALPGNLHILFSAWTNLKPVNPYKLPETNVIPRGADPAPEWKMCGGNCFSCACRGVGCWQAAAGDTIAFKIH